MSNFIRRTKNPATGKFEDAEWLDDYFGKHSYGIRFPSGFIYKEDSREWEFDDTPQPPKEDTDELRNEIWEILEYNFGRDRRYKRDIETMDEIMRHIQNYALQRSREAEIAGRIDELDRLWEKRDEQMVGSKLFPKAPLMKTHTINGNHVWNRRLSLKKQHAELTKKREEK